MAANSRQATGATVTATDILGGWAEAALCPPVLCSEKWSV